MRHFTEVFKCNKCGAIADVEPQANGMWLVECKACKQAELSDEDALMFPEEIDEADEVGFC